MSEAERNASGKHLNDKSVAADHPEVVVGSLLQGIVIINITLIK